ncbi:PTS galactitol transporter subunit IIC [Tepidimicrobium xylanilyticum]|uniref:PTS galactitol transporter subunit IIC n=1 Tax=Tepidimicrobium xylanilyticum TaxID=1123352 RepID=UPI00264CCD7B|nr:PTS transporter subunit IIC [Tepidimicrobium xylanilyticum]GMG97919.1 PTS galactitol transporter subunit IIC [Tepidimicrobium xylanilyticum]
MELLDKFVDLGPTVVMPIIFTIMGLAFGVKFGKALRSGLTVAVGFIGLNLVIGLLGDTLGPAAQAMVHRLGLELTIIDVGWPAASAIAFASKVGALIIPLGLAVNLLMLFTKTTETVNIDIWNYWHFAFTGALVAGVTGRITYGLIAAAFNMIIIMVLADLTAPMIEENLGMPGISLPHGFSAAYVPIAIVVNKIIDMIPGINKIDISAEGMEKKLGVFGEPILVGTILGILVGVAAGYPIGEVLQMGVTLGAVLVLIPRMAKMLMEGLLPISESAQQFIQKRTSKGGKIYIGLDSAIGVGHPVTLAVSLILVPLTVVLAAIIPGNKVLPFADLAVIPFALVMIVPVTKGNVFRTVIVGLLIISFGLLIATNLAPLHTQMAIDANFTMPEGASLISSICDGANPLSWIFAKTGGLDILGLVIMGVISIGLALYNRKRILKQSSDMKI